jgi:hypothetical protein
VKNGMDDVLGSTLAYPLARCLLIRSVSTLRTLDRQRETNAPTRCADTGHHRGHSPIAVRVVWMSRAPQQLRALDTPLSAPQQPLVPLSVCHCERGHNG